jgi:hypothetical protein
MADKALSPDCRLNRPERRIDGRCALIRMHDIEAATKGNQRRLSANDTTTIEQG